MKFETNLVYHKRHVSHEVEMIRSSYGKIMKLLNVAKDEAGKNILKTYLSYLFFPTLT